MNASLPQLKSSINYFFQHNSFPQELKLSEVIPLYKKLEPLQKKNYRPVSLLPHTSKVFEGIINKQMTNYMRDKANKSITGFRKSNRTQHSLIGMVERWKRAIDKGGCVSTLFMDLLKTFDTIKHDLMIAKLKAYGFSGEALKFMQSYLKNRKQRFQINSKSSFGKDVNAGVPQGSVNGPLLVNLFKNNLASFIKQSTLSSYADDNNLFVSGKDKELTKSLLGSDFKNWFFKNYMILDPGKYHFMCISKNITDSELLNFNELIVKKNCKEVAILGITLDQNLDFRSHIKNLCRKVGQNLSALIRVSS